MLAARRVGGRMRRAPVIGFVSGAGDANLGDEIMLAALRGLLAGAVLEPIDFPATEARLARLGLSGPRVFSGLVLGGGTLINPHFLPRVTSMGGSLPGWTLGTGVGSSGFGMAQSVPLDDWRDALRNFRAAWVRGPRSASILQGLGVRRVEVVGDLALAATPDTALARPRDRVLAINVGGRRAMAADDIDHQALHEELAALLASPLAVEWRLVPFAMHRDDLPAVLDLAHRLPAGRCARPVLLRSMHEIDAMLAGVRAVVAMRLHGAVLAWTRGVPALLLGYREKCADFAEQLGVEDLLASLDGSPGASVPAGLARLLDTSDERALRVHADCLFARERLRRAGAEIVSTLLEISPKPAGVPVRT